MHAHNEQSCRNMSIAIERQQQIDANHPVVSYISTGKQFSVEHNYFIY
jgi:hypothetical protein